MAKVVKMVESEPVRRMPKRIVRLALPEPYDASGFWVDGVANFSQRTRQKLLSGDPAQTVEAFTEMIVGHNLVDEDGRAFPPAGDPSLFEALPTDLAVLVIREVLQSPGKFPPPPAMRGELPASPAVPGGR
jgi:hypothetical protein